MRKTVRFAGMLAAFFGAANGMQAYAQQEFVPGLVKAEIYSNIGGGVAMGDLTNNAAYPSKPSSTAFVSAIEYPPGGSDGRPPAADVGSNYGVRISGYIIPTENGSYTFYISSDDAGAFYLSTDDTASNRRLLAWEPVWNGVRSFEVDSSGGRVECLNGDCENVSDPVPLTQGQRYYFEALMKEGGGGDNLAIAWSKDGAPIETFTYPNPDTTVGGDLTTQLPIGSAYLGTMADTTVSITKQPGSTAAAVGGSAVFTVGINATPNVTYQWRKDGANIPGATNSTYATPPVVIGDNNATYSVVATKTGGNSVTSSNATLTVAALSEVQGVVLFEAWPGIGGTTVPTVFSTLPPAGEYAAISSADSRLVYPDDLHNDYLGKLSGYFVPRVSGNYNFFVSSDDASALWISSNSTFPNPETDTPVARETDCCEGFQEPFVPNDDQVTYPTTETPIEMVAGQKYAFVFYWKEGGGGDYGRIAFRLDTDTTAAASLTAIGSTNLVSLVPGLGITTHPQDISVEENRTGTFTVGTLSTPGLTFQWESAPVGSSTFAPVTGATSRTITVNAPRTDNGRQYRVVVTSGTQSATSAPATITVTDDVTPPVISSIGSFHNLTGLMVYFNEPVNAAAGTYSLSGGATIQSSTQLGPNTVFLQTSPLTASTAYTLTVGNIRDYSANGGNLVSPNTANFTSSAAAPTPMTQGFAKYQRWEALSPNTIAQLIIDIANRAPDIEETVVGFEGPSNASDNYGGRLTGWVIPPEDGNYVFAAATDDNARLWLSTDSNPANKKLIAQETAWSAVRAWTGGIPDKVSSSFAQTEWPTGNRVTLKGGQPYYIELIWQDGTGGDNGSATFWLEGETPANGTQTAIRGTALFGNVAPVTDGAPLIVEAPAGRNFNKGDTVTLTVNAVGAAPLTYQWLRNKKVIAGATSATYTITGADHRAVGDYSVLVSNGFGSVESNYDNADDNARLLMNGAFIIEAEDYNYQGGQHVPSASTMPYLGNAYTGLVPTLDVDYFNGPDESAGDVNAYAYGPRTALAAEGTVETKGGGDAVNNEFNRNRGSFTVNANYAIGWGGVGDWQNYTRTFPAGRYAIFSAGAQDGTPDPDPAARTIGLDSTLSKVTNPTAADNSSVGIEGGSQGLTKLGVFQSPTSGAWSSNDLIPLTDETTGAIVEVQLSGTETLRWSNNSNQDMDYLLLFCLDCQDVTRPTMQVARSSGNITITWTGAGFRVQESSNLTTWTDVQGATGSPVTLPTSGTHKFYRLIQ